MVQNRVTIKVESVFFFCFLEQGEVQKDRI